MSNKNKFAEDLTSFALVILGIILVVILMSSCATNKSSYYQDHLRSTHNHNFVKQDNGGCGWNR
jgi:uncharacterized membrane protein SpoIIM required for sporulation